MSHSAAAASRQAAAGGGRPASFVSAYGFWNLRKRHCRCCLLGSRSLLPLESRTRKERRPFSVVAGAAIGRLKPFLIMILLSGCSMFQILLFLTFLFVHWGVDIGIIYYYTDCLKTR
ncbi:uncharacterized protein [Arachis hypogaea]